MLRQLGKTSNVTVVWVGKEDETAFVVTILWNKAFILSAAVDHKLGIYLSIYGFIY